MSDSDDTDVLVHIPPNIFIEPIERDLEFNYLQTEVVSSLLSQVDELENRVSFIESINSSCANDSITEIRSNNSMVLNECDNGENSVSSICHNEELACQGDLVSPPLALNTCEINSNTESSLDLNHGENGMSKSKESLLKEIDLYLSNLNYKHSREEGGSTQSYDLNSNTGDQETHTMAEDVPIQTPPFKRLDLPEVDRLLKEMEATQLEIENKLRSRENDYGLGKQRSLMNVTHRKSFPPSENFASSNERNSAPYSTYTSPLKIEDLDKRKHLDEFTSKRDIYLVGSSHNSDSDDARKNGDNLNFGNKDLRASTSFDSRKRFVSPRRRLFTQQENLPERKSASGQSSSSNIPHNSGKSLQKVDYFSQLAAGDGFSQRPIIRGNDVNIQRKPPQKYNREGLLSLAELWKNERDLSEDDSKKLRQKLEEEKFRRIHLENTIQDLQRRVLEEQEKLAVAVKVDEGKDKAIAQITEAWKQMVNHWREIEADRHAMSQSIIKERASIKQTQEEINKKVERWEKEVSQALDLAAGYKTKCEFLENELSSTLEANNEKVAELEKKIKTNEEELLQLNEERRLLTEKLNLSQEEHNKEKQLVELAQKEVATLQETLKKTEAELSIVTEQRDLLTTRLREEKGRNALLEQKKASIQEALDETKQKLMETEEAMKNSAATLEKTKTELRGVYQSQLEAVVKEKLEEFQSQLDKAQAAMKTELIEARKLAQERSAAQQQALVNSHMLEVRRLETSYKEQIRSLEAKLAESERRREKLESGKKEIAHRLHGVMEAQWQQALSIITSEMSLRQGESEVSKNKIQANENKVSKMAPLEAESMDDTSFDKDIQPENHHHSKKDTLLKYIQMLLDKQPGKPIDSGSSSQWPDVTQSDTLDDTFGEHKWNQVISNIPSSALPEGTLKPVPPNQRKPPWK